MHKELETIKWGIIGCGDVAEIKSGPAFQTVENSELLGVMRRDRAKAKDFAQRHKVPLWTNNANDLLENSEINAIYVATPPSSHKDYAIAALMAGKHVYLEKPMTLNVSEGVVLSNALKNSTKKITVAHYRRKLPAFEKVKSLLAENSIGKVILADIQLFQPKKSNIVAQTDENWRLNPEISGGGYFYDLAPHQIDLMYHYFGRFEAVSGYATAKRNKVEETVNGIIRFKNGIQFRGLWNFTAPETYTKEECTIYGSEGTIRFSFYGDKVKLCTANQDKTFTFKNPKHIQEPMIAATVNYFLGDATNPCSVEEGLDVMKAMEKLSGRQ
ncbi:MAG: Gfo/Idh/MocA family oxidoreductase [Bacteroidota bacterium]